MRLLKNVNQKLSLEDKNKIDKFKNNLARQVTSIMKQKIPDPEEISDLGRNLFDMIGKKDKGPQKITLPPIKPSQLSSSPMKVDQLVNNDMLSKIMEKLDSVIQTQNAQKDLYTKFDELKNDMD